MRLIDGDVLWEKLDDEPWYDNADRDEIALPIVAAAPTVDAVVVTRCKDCAHSGQMEPQAIIAGTRKTLSPMVSAGIVYSNRQKRQTIFAATASRRRCNEWNLLLKALECSL